MVGDILRTPDLEVISVGYDYFDLLRFLVPGPWRRGPVEMARRELASALARYPGERSRVSVIAHSYGTYAISRVLAENRTMRLEHLVLCGSIAKMAGYDWAATLFQVQGKVINDYGVKDPWPVVAKAVTWGFGDAGSYGMRIDRAMNRDHDFGHSGFMRESFVRDFWQPLFARGEVVYPVHPGDRRPTQPWWFRLLALPWKWIAIVLVIAAAAWVSQPPVRYAIARLFDQTVDSRAVDLTTLLSVDCDLKLAPPTGEELAQVKADALAVQSNGWLDLAIGEIGQREIAGDQSNRRIIEYNRVAGLNTANDETAWNSQFVGWALRQSGHHDIMETGLARAWKNWGYDILSDGDVVVGSVVVTERPEEPSWGGVVGFYLGSDPWASEPSFRMLAGNICGAVSVITVPESLRVTYRMPNDWQGPAQ